MSLSVRSGGVRVFRGLGVGLRGHGVGVRV